MTNPSRPIPVEEQLRNAKAMILMATTQPIVREAIKAYAAEHSSEAERAPTAPAGRKHELYAPASTGKAVESSLPLLPGRFSYREVAECLEPQGVVLKVRHTRTAIGAVLHRLCETGAIHQVQKGIGGKPAYYERAY